MPRVTWYLGRWIRGTDWYPDYQLRLYDRRAARWNGRRVHESVELIDGPPGLLRHELQHYAYRDISDHLATIDRYTTLAAEQWLAEGRRTNAVEIARPSAGRLPAQLRAARRHSGRRRRPARLGAELVLRLPEVREAVGAAAAAARSGAGAASRRAHPDASTRSPDRR